MRLRFAAPAATSIHVGTARIALLAWLLARRHGGTFALRLDDTGLAGDPEAVPPDAPPVPAVDPQPVQDLRWLGLDWDDLVVQSARADRYAAAIAHLKAANRIYPCFEQEAELNAKRERRQRRGEATLYDRAMLKLTPEQRSRAEAGGKRPYWRFMLSGYPATWGDMVLGRQEVKISALSDPILVRADGTPTPALRVAVDDLDDGTTHVLRGADRLEETGVQIDLMAALGMRGPPVRFAHLPPLADAKTGKPLARAASPTLRHLRADGIEPAALAGTLARIGTRQPPAPALPRDLAPNYDLAGLSRTPPRFDPGLLLRVNRAALGGLGFDDAQPRLPTGATPAFWHSVRGSLDLMRDVRGWWEVVTGTVVPPLVEGEEELLRRAAILLPAEPWDGGTWDRWMAALHEATGRGAKSLAGPLRLALTGEDEGPDLATLLPLIGQARVAERLRLASA